MGYIYIIKNTINDKVYIGQTTNTVEYRFHQHLDNVERSYKQGHLYNAMRKYGKNNFFIEVIEQVHDKDLNEREKYWIKYYDSFNNGYNSTIGGDGNRKIEYEPIIEDWYNGLSECEIRQKYNICETLMWKILNLYNIPLEDRKLRFAQSKQQNTDEKILELWNLGYSIRQIKNEFGGGRETIKKQLLRQGITEEEICRRGVNKRGKPVNQYTLNDEYITTYNTAKEASLALGHTNPSSIRKACLGQLQHAYGYKWKYK